MSQSSLTDGFGFRRAVRAVRSRAGSWLMPSAHGNREYWYAPDPSCSIPDLGGLFERFLGRRDSGQFVDVGAYDGVQWSNTWGLAKRGWKGVMVEPNPETARRLRRNVDRFPSVSVVECAVGAKDGSSILLYLGESLTTAARDLHAEYSTKDWAQSSLSSRTVRVACRTLDAILTEAGLEPPLDVLSVDVEGWEREVFGGFDLRRWSPAVLLVELTEVHPDLAASAKDHASLLVEICDSGWLVAYKDAVNSVFVRRDVWMDSFGLSDR